MFRCVMCGEDMHPDILETLVYTEQLPDLRGGRLCGWCSSIYYDDVDVEEARQQRFPVRQVAF